MKRGVILSIGIGLLALVIWGAWMFLPSWAEYGWYQDVGASALVWRRIGWYGLWLMAGFWVPWVLLWVWFGVARRRWNRGMIWLALIEGVCSVVLVWWGRKLTWGLLVPPAGVQEALLHLDVMWYVAWLPFWRSVAIYGSVFLGILVVVDGLVVSPPAGKRDGMRVVLLGLLLFSLACVGMLWSFEMFIWQPHRRIGIGFSDFYGTLLAWWVGIGVFVGLGIMWLVLFLLKRLHGRVFFLQLVVSVAVVGGVFFLWPWALSQFYEKPNELQVQKRFIAARRLATRTAFGLVYEPFSFQPTLESLAYVRLWDTQPYLLNMRQSQTIRNYFDFMDADVDFYEVSNRLVQVLLACRELTMENFLPEVKSWENMHLRYTHGFGVVVSPAHLMTPEGLPVLWLRHLSLETEIPEFRLKRPQVYFGEADLPYAFVRTEVKEFEYTDSTNRVETVYEGTNGVRLSWLRRLAISRLFEDKNMLFTRYFTPQTGVLWRRNILKRLRFLVPDLAYDPDPYPVIVDGEISWIVDAYTKTDRYPLSERYDSRWGRINALRNSVKVVVSAYTGMVKYYVVDKEDPLVAPLRFFGGDLFSDEVPEAFRKHFRYPYAFLALQAEVFGRYHMDSDESFYNGDDVWAVPMVKQGETNLPYEPIYLLLETETASVPGVFVPFTPMYRQNLVGWLYGRYENGLRLYQYVATRTESIPGPSQVEAKMYQDNELSQLFTLWGQRNSTVSLGMVRYLPFGKDVMAMVPVYLSSQYNPIPQVAMVVVLYRDRIYADKTIQGVIDALRRDTRGVQEERHG